MVHHGPKGWILVALVGIAAGCNSGAPPPPPDGEVEPAAGKGGAEPQVLGLTLAGQAARPDDDPTSDGWETEVFSRAAGKQLKKLVAMFEQPGAIAEAVGPDSLRGIVSDGFFCGSLRPEVLVPVHEDRLFRVSRGHGGGPGDQFRGPEGFADAVREWFEPFDGTTDRRMEIKIFRVEREGESSVTQVLVATSGAMEAGSLEEHTRWTCTWVDGGEAGPRLASVAVGEMEQTRLRCQSRKLFSDCTLSVLGENDWFQPQMMRGMYHWAGAIQRVILADFEGNSGLAVGDVNGDGWDDVYLCQPGGLGDRLLIQNEDGTVTDRSAQAGVDWMEPTLCALLVDLDQDGDQDLILSTAVALLVMANDGSGRFELRTELPEVRYVFALTAADYDQDGDLDLFAGRYFAKDRRPNNVPNPIPYHDANNGGVNHLLRNDGGFEFTDVTKELGMDDDNTRWTYSASWEDFDNDGDLDLYVANDFGRNCLYLNEEGRFRNVAAEAGVEDTASGMSVSWGDFNHDGWMDVYVGNMFSTAGNRIAFQEQFQPTFAPSTKALVQRLAKGNTLFANNSDGTFTDVSMAAGVTMGRWAWSSVFIDLDNNGWEDLVVANGYLTAPDTGDL